MTSLKHKTLSGVKWVFVATIAQRVITFGTTVILARILTPADFGLFALAFVMIDGFSLFKSLGFDSALVRRKEGDIAAACNTAFFLIPSMGIILFTVLFFFAPVGAKMLGNAEVGNIIRALAFVFVISCFGKVPQSILYREMKFKYKTIAELSGYIVYAVTAVALALTGRGVWSLVTAYLLRNLVQITIEWIASRWVPKFEFNKTIAWDMFHFGKYIFAGGVLWFLNSNLDNIIVGKYLGVEMLGYYAIAFNLATFLSTYFLGKVGMVMYPAYAKIQDDKSDVVRVMLKAVRMISILVFPFAFLICAFASDILILVLGEKWLPAANVLRILAWVGLLRSIGSALWPIFMAQGKTKTDFMVNFASVGTFFVIIVPLALKFKLEGAGIAVLVSTLVSFAIGLFRISRILDLRIFRIFAVMKPAFLCSVIMAAGGLFVQRVTMPLGGSYNILLSGGSAIFIYLGVYYILDKDLFSEVKINLFNKNPEIVKENHACPQKH